MTRKDLRRCRTFAEQRRKGRDVLDIAGSFWADLAHFCCPTTQDGGSSLVGSLGEHVF
jgi:hypothetical protein